MHVDEFVLIRPDRRPADVGQNMTVEPDVGFLGVEQDAVAVEGDDFEGAETILRMRCEHCRCRLH